MNLRLVHQLKIMLFDGRAQSIKSRLGTIGPRAAGTKGEDLP